MARFPSSSPVFFSAAGLALWLVADVLCFVNLPGLGPKLQKVLKRTYQFLIGEEGYA